MAQRNFVEWGIFPATEQPFAVPTSVWDSAPALGILINEDWIPYVVGALKVMMRDAMWKNDSGSVFPTLQQIDDLLSSWRVLVDPNPETDWQINCVVQEEAPQFAQQVTGIPGIAGNYGWRTGYFFSQNTSLVGGSMDMHITFGDIPANDPVGVPIYDFIVQARFPFDAISVTAVDCLGGTHAATGLGTVGYTDIFTSPGPFAIKEIVILADSDHINCVVQGAGPIQCALG